MKHYLLYVLGLSAGETVWTSERSTWSGRRNLVKTDNYSSLATDGGDAKYSLSPSVSLSWEEGLLSTLPSWCSFGGTIRCYSDYWNSMM